MPATITAPSGASRPLIPFSIKLRSSGYSIRFTALAYSSADALCNALTLPDLAPPLCASVKPLTPR